MRLALSALTLLASAVLSEVASAQLTPELATYDVHFGVVRVGSATVTTSVDTLDGVPTCHAKVSIRGGFLFFRVSDDYESWFECDGVITRRYAQHIREGNYRRERNYFIVDGKVVYGADTLAGVTEPVDDVSLLFLLRRLPLEVGDTTVLSRYFIADRNPLTVTVEARDTIKVGAGTFPTLRLRPTVKARGIFAEGGRAQLWVADDSTRVLVQIKTSLKFGSLNLYLRSRSTGPSVPSAVAAPGTSSP